MSIPNGKTWLRLEFIVHNGHHLLTFELWVKATLSILSILRLCVFGSLHTYHSSLTVPMSHYEYTKWQDMVEIGIHCPQWSPFSDFSAVGGIKPAISRPIVSTLRLCVFGSLYTYHSSLTAPMSPYKYTKWQDMIEIGIHCQ